MISVHPHNIILGFFSPHLDVLLLGLFVLKMEALQTCVVIYFGFSVPHMGTTDVFSPSKKKNSILN